jgi:hypothetical protein
MQCFCVRSLAVRENGGNNIIPYDKFKSIFADMVNVMKAKVANYADSWQQ